MGIEPTRDFVEPHTGFEDQGRHQAASHLQVVEIVGATCVKGKGNDRPAGRAIPRALTQCAIAYGALQTDWMIAALQAEARQACSAASSRAA